MEIAIRGKPKDSKAMVVRTNGSGSRLEVVTVWCGMERYGEVRCTR